jgi:hypothetical protein
MSGEGNFMLAKLIGLGILVVVFVITVLLMPKIFGVNPPTVIAGASDDPEAPGRPADPPAR